MILLAVVISLLLGQNPPRQAVSESPQAIFDRAIAGFMHAAARVHLRQLQQRR